MKHSSLDNDVISFSAKLAALGFNAPDAIEDHCRDLVKVIGYQLKTTITDPKQREQIIENYKTELLKNAGITPS